MPSFSRSPLVSGVGNVPCKGKRTHLGGATLVKGIPLDTRLADDIGRGSGGSSVQNAN